MKKFRIYLYDIKGKILYSACEYAENRMQALTKWVNYPHRNPLDQQMHQIEISDAHE